MSELLWIVPMGLLVGIALGALGGGGSILSVPVLVYLLHQSPAAATTGSLMIVGIASLVAAVPHYRRGNVSVKQGVVFGVLGVAGAVLGSRLASGVPGTWLLSGFAVLMLVVAVLMILRLRRKPDQPTGNSTPSKTQWVRVVVTASGVGLLTGFFGVGGGFAIVPALVLALGLGMPVAVGTSLLVIAINSGVALAARIGGGISLDWVTIGAFSVVATAGSLIGARISAKVSARTLGIAFVVLLITVALYMGITSIAAVFAGG